MEPTNRTKQMLASIVREGEKRGNNALIAERYGVTPDTVSHAKIRYKEYLEGLYEQKGLTPEYVIGGLKRVAENSENDMATIKSLELIGKHIGMWKERVAKNNEDDKSDEELIAEIDALKEAVILHRRKGAIEAETAEVVDGGEQDGPGGVTVRELPGTDESTT